MFNEGVGMDTMWNSFKFKLNLAINRNMSSKSFVQRNESPWVAKKNKKMSKRKQNYINRQQQHTTGQITDIFKRNVRKHLKSRRRLYK